MAAVAVANIGTDKPKASKCERNPFLRRAGRQATSTSAIPKPIARIVASWRAENEVTSLIAESKIIDFPSGCSAICDNSAAVVDKSLTSEYRVFNSFDICICLLRWSCFDSCDSSCSRSIAKGVLPLKIKSVICLKGSDKVTNF